MFLENTRHNKNWSANFNQFGCRVQCSVLSVLTLGVWCLSERARCVSDVWLQNTFFINTYNEEGYIFISSARHQETLLSSSKRECQWAWLDLVWGSTISGSLSSVVNSRVPHSVDMKKSDHVNYILTWQMGCAHHMSQVARGKFVVQLKSESSVLCTYEIHICQFLTYIVSLKGYYNPCKDPLYLPVSANVVLLVNFSDGN